MANWTPDMDEVLTARWVAGESTRVIAAAIGVSRFAVIGRAHRIGCPVHKDGNQNRMSLAAEKRSKRPHVPKPRGPHKGPKLPKLKGLAVDIVDSAIPLEQRKTLFELGEHDCRFPVGDPTKGFWCNDSFYYCAAPTDGSPYCAGHAARVYNFGASHSAKRERPIRWGAQNQTQVQVRPVQSVGE